MAQLSDRRHPRPGEEQLYTFINVFGLAIGLAACLMLLLYVRYEIELRRLAARRRARLPAPGLGPRRGQRAAGRDRSRPPIVSGASAEEGFPAVRACRLRPRTARRSSSRTARRRAARISSTSTGRCSTCFSFRFLRGDRRTALASPGTIVLTEAEAREAVRHRRPGRQDPDDDRRGQGHRLSDHRRGRGLPRHSHLALSIVARFDPATFFGRPGGFPDRVDAEERLGLCQARARASTSPRSPGRCRPGRSATFPTRSSAASASIPATTTTGGWSTSATSISAWRSEAGCGRATTGGRSSPSRSWPALILAHGGGQLHQPRHRPRQPARPRGRACARCSGRRGASSSSSSSANRCWSRRSRCCSRWRWSSSSCRCSIAFLEVEIDVHYFGAGGLLAADPRPGAAGRRRRRPLSGFLPVALPAGHGAQGEQVVGRCAGHRPAAQRCSSSASSPSRSA